MGREDFSQSSQLSTLVGKPTNRYQKLPKNVNTLRRLTEAKAKPNNRYHYSIYPLVQKEYQASYTQLTNLDFYSPIITIKGSAIVSHLIGTTYEDAGVTVDEGSTLISTVSTVDDTKFGIYSVTYTSTDGINPDTTVVRTVKVGLPPDVTINGQNPFNLEKFDVYVDPGITINDSNSFLTSTTSTLNNLAVGTYTVNYTVSNPAFTKVFSRTVRVDDTIPPVITIAGDNPYTLERFGVYTDPGATVDLGSELTNTDLSNVQNTAFGSFDVVYTAYDGNTTVTATRTVNVVDTVPPVITILGDNPYTLERFDVYTDQGATVDLGSELTNTDLSNEQNTAVGTFDVVYTAYDGNTTVTATRTVTVVDTKLPELTLIGDTSPYNLQPGIDFENVDPGFSNDAGTVVTVDYSNASIIQNTSFDVVYRGNDGVHPDIVLIRKVAVADTLSPVVILNGPSVVTLERYAEYVEQSVTLDPGSSLVSTITDLDNTTVGSYTVTYLATDGINPDTTNVRTVHVVDTTPPIVFLNGADPLTMERFGVFSDIDPGVTYQAPHTGTLTSVDISQLDNTAIGGGTVTYNVVDDENNSNTISRAVTVVDTTPPVATLNNASTNYTLERYGDWSAIDPGVTVDAGSFVKEINIDNTVVGLNRPVDYVISDGNTLHDITVTRTITIQDTVPPYAELIGSNNIRVPLYSVWEDVDPGLTNFDIGSSLVSVTGFSNTETDAQFVYYNLTDGVNSNIILRVVTCTTPDGTVNTAVSTTLERFGTYVEPDEAIIVTDGYVARIDTSNVDSTAAHGTQQMIVYDLGDNINNTLVTRTITIQDTVPPFAELIGSNNIRVPLYSVWEDVDPGLTNFDTGSSLVSVTGFDNTVTYVQTVSYNLTDGVNSNIVYRDVTCTLPGGTVNTAVSTTLERFGTYVEPDEAIIVTDGYVARIDTSNVDSTAAHGTQQMIVYDLGDNINNTLVTRTITIQDTVPPFAELIGSNNIRVPLYSVWEDVDPGLTNFDTGSSLVSVTGFDNTVTYVQTVSYNLTDGVNSNIVYRDVTCTLPGGTVNTAVSTTLERFSTYVEPDEAIIVTDGYVARIDTSNVDSTATRGTQQMIVYDLGDNVNNTLVTRTITIQDTVAPVITITNDTITGNTLERFDVYSDEGATVDQGSQLTTDLTQVQNTAVGSFNVVYTATDGNTTVTSTRTVTVVDTTPPVLTLAGDNPYEVIGRTTYVDPGATADGGETVTVNTSGVNMNAPGDYTVTYSATDAYGNIGTASRTVTVLFGWPQHQKIQASDKQGGDYFGLSVSISGDGNTAIVGAYQEDAVVGTNTYAGAGAAYIFTWSETSSSWSEQQKIQASDKSPLDGFGYSVAISSDGNTVIAGAKTEGTYYSGAAYIFTWSETSSSWSEQQKIQASDKQGSDYFGESVAISSDGNTAIVGVRFEDTGGTEAGAAYIFTRSNSSWTQQQKIQASDKQSFDYFGWSVAISGDGNTAIVGAHREDTVIAGFNPILNTGAAYIFTRSNSSWTQQQKIQASDKQRDDNFGYSVAISGDGNTAIVGARGEGGTGAAYIFTWSNSNSNWSEQDIIHASDKQSGDGFGNSVSISEDGNTAIVGANYEDAVVGTNTITDTGAAYIFTRSGTTWTQQQKIQASDKQAYDHFGSFDANGGVTISGDGNTTIVGASHEDTGGTNAGAAYIYKYIT
jgi:hydrogenase-4 membrane subunit HyfE